MPYVSVHIDASEVLDDLDDKELREELERRDSKKKERPDPIPYQRQLLEQAYRDVRGKCPSRAMADYFYEVLGKIA